MGRWSNWPSCVLGESIKAIQLSSTEIPLLSYFRVGFDCCCVPDVLLAYST